MVNTQSEILFMMKLRLAAGFGCASFKKIAEKFHSVEEIKSCAELPDISSKELEGRALDEIAQAKKEGVEIVHYFDPRYPSALREIYDPPVLLYVKGRLPESAPAWIGVVGSRVPSLYGQKMARMLSRDLARAGVVVVSGMAMGIDAAAHEGSLLGGGTTVGVLGCGLKEVYPKENMQLSKNIIENGALVSEYPLSTVARPEYFPARNRIIAGLCQAVLVVEAKEKSGALITADCALREGRDVYAVPGNADSPRSAGTNQLIRLGAKLITRAEEVLDELNIVGLEKKILSTEGLGVLENRLLSVLEENETIFVDELIERSGVSAREAASILPVLEIKGLVRQLPGKNFERV
jgi:DNA processing protein